jgi:cysteine desulfurase
MMQSVAQINLDYNATAPLRSVVCNEIVRVLSEINGNPSSIHRLGRDARSILESARTRIANALSVESRQIVFTSGATESNTMILCGFKGPILVSAVEHSSILDVRDDVTLAPVDENGIVYLEFIEKWLQEHPGKSLVSVMAANNETGVIQPVEKISELCKSNCALFHSDVVQAVGRMPLDMHLFDCVSLSGHKLGGLAGVGCVIIKDGFPLSALLKGGGQERSYRSGTENLVGIISFAAALEAAMGTNESKEWQRIKDLRLMMEDQLAAVCSSIRIMGQTASRLPNTTCVTMPGMKAETQVMQFDLEGIALSAGSACSSGKVKKSRVLTAMGIPDAVAETAIRISLSPQTTKNDIDSLVSIWKKIYQSIKHNNIEANAA